MVSGTSRAYFENQMSNSLNKELKGKTVLLKKSHFRDDVTDLRFVCEDGFGVNAFTNGTSIYGYWVSDGKKDKVGGYDVESVVE